jgi:hypothetical protein
MVVVGEAVVRIRIISDRMQADIREAVKRGVAGSGGDLDAAGESIGERVSKGAANGIRKNTKVISKELELSARRFTADAGGVIDDQSSRLGRRFVTGLGNGINDDSAWNKISITARENFSRALGQGWDKDSQGFGREFMQALAAGVQSGEPELQRSVTGSMRRALTSGSNDRDTSKLGSDVSKRFIEGIGDGFNDSTANFQEDIRRSFRMRPGDIEDDGRIVGDTFGRGTNDGYRNWFQRLRATADAAAQRMAAGAGSRYRAAQEAGSRFADNLNDGMRSKFNDIRDTGSRLTDRLGDGIRSRMPQLLANARQHMGALQMIFRWKNNALNQNEKDGEEITNAIGRGVRRGSSKLGTLFSGLGKSLGDHFNLGIGAAKMGQGIISILATAGPSLLAGAAALGTSMAAEIITALGAIGPGLAGAVGVGLAAVSSLVLSAGLLFAAFKSGVAGISELGERFKSLGKALGTPIAENMLSGFNDLVSNLERALPQLNAVLRQTGIAFGNLARRIGETVTSAENMSRIQGILATNNTFIDNLGRAIAGLTTSFLILFNAAKPFVDYIGQAAAGFAEWAANSLAVSEANGNLAAWMDSMLAAFKDLPSSCRSQPGSAGRSPWNLGKVPGVDI